MRQIKAAIAGIVTLLAVAQAAAQQLPPVPANSVVGRTSVTGDTGTLQAIPFAQLAASLSPFGLALTPSSGTPGNAVIFGATPNLLVDSGSPPFVSVTTTVSNSLGADVLLNNTAVYFDGPSAAQGTSGTWLATGSVNIAAGGTPDTFYCKLWDGTTVIASSSVGLAASFQTTLSLSGVISNPTGNLRISCRPLGTTIAKIQFNVTGTSKDSTITALRIQ